MHSEIPAPDSRIYKTLLVVGSNPPKTSGQRTLARAEQARLILNYDHFDIANVFSVPTHRTTDVATVGALPTGWLDARGPLAHALDRASAVLLAYGVGKPAGVAARHYKEQLAWLNGEIEQRGLTVWWVGGAARHPSRWQRYTFRAYPEMPFSKALQTALTIRTLGGQGL